MPVTWNDAADAKLLVSILQTSNPKLDYKAIAKLMGNDCTKNAIKCRIQRLKERVNSATTASVDGGSSVPGTPEKRKRGGAKKNAGGDTPGKRAKIEAAEGASNM